MSEAMLRLYFFACRHNPLSGQKGAGAVEYVISMAITFIVLLGVFELFRAMSISIYDDFSQWICAPYP
jgi:Tfp pilus assembly protein PilW